MIIVSGQVFSVDEQVMVFVQLPELAVNHVEVLVAEEVGDLVDVVFLLKGAQCGEQCGPAQLGQRDLAAPGPVYHVENSSYHL